MKKMNKKGFTIVELIIVIAVIAILSAVMIPTFSSLTKKAKLSAAQQEADAALTAVFTEENAQLDTNNKYYFYVDGYWFEYSHTTRALDKVDAPVDTEADEGDRIYTYDGTLSDEAPITIAQGGTPAADLVTPTALEDLGKKVIVWVD